MMEVRTPPCAVSNWLSASVVEAAYSYERPREAQVEVVVQSALPEEPVETQVPGVVLHLKPQVALSAPRSVPTEHPQSHWQSGIAALETVPSWVGSHSTSQ